MGRNSTRVSLLLYDVICAILPMFSCFDTRTDTQQQHLFLTSTVPSELLAVDLQ